MYSTYLHYLNIYSLFLVLLTEEEKEKLRQLPNKECILLVCQYIHTCILIYKCSSMYSSLKWLLWGMSMGVKGLVTKNGIAIHSVVDRVSD